MIPAANSSHATSSMRLEREKVYVRPVRRIGGGNRSGPVRSAVSDRSGTDLGLGSV